MKRLAHILLSLLLVVAFLTTSRGYVFEHCLCSDKYTLIVNRVGKCCKKDSPCMEKVVKSLSPSNIVAAPTFSFDCQYMVFEEPANNYLQAPIINIHNNSTPLVVETFSPPPRAYLHKICLLQI